MYTGLRADIVQPLDALLQNSCDGDLILVRRKVVRESRYVIRMRQHGQREGRQSLDAGDANPGTDIASFICGVVF